MSETIRIDDMRLFAFVVAAGSMTAAARELGLPKQSVSRRIADLERSLGLKLLHRTAKRVTPTERGLAYAERCAEIARLSEEANRAVGDRGEEPTGTLRISADPTFGEAFLADVVIAFARRWPSVAVDVRLSRRRVDIVRDGFDVAFRVGRVDEVSLTGIELAPAEVRYCASPAYVAARGEPAKPRDLARHDCIVVGHDEGPVRWPFRATRGGVQALPIEGRVQTSSFAMSLACARAGLGIAIAPEFACLPDVEAGRLVTVLDRHRISVGSVWLLHPTRAFVTPRVRAFVALARAHFAKVPVAAPRSG
jgi:DNA-binding transcriptional LysR family regulator